MEPKLGWKVPFRQVYCDTFTSWMKQTLWCHLVIKVFPHCIDLGSSCFLEEYKKDPVFFHDQYKFMIDRALRHQRGEPPLDPMVPVTCS